MFTNDKRSIILKTSLALIVESLILILILILIPLIKKISVVNAQPYAYAYTEIPESIDEFAVPPPVVPCLDVNYRYEDGTLETGYRNPEFHSLRPYQASPCGDAPKAFFCNNDYTIIEDVSMQWDPSRCSGSGGTYICTPIPNATKCGPISPTGGQACANTYIIGGQDGRDYVITLSKAQYPILGNTQNFFNSQSSVEEFDETGKMTEYVNWYLQGVPERAEYGRKYTNIADQVTFAGPPKKLLPYDILNFARLEVLHDAGVKPPDEIDAETYEGPSELVYYDPAKDGYYTRQTLNHNQIAVCTGGSIGDMPIPCYKGNGSKALGSPRRLVIWWESRGSTPTQTFFNWNINNVWGGQTPPFPWQFDDGYLYRKAFSEWTGQECVVVPFTNRYVCFSTYINPCNIVVPIMCAALNQLPGGSVACGTGAVANSCQAATIGIVNIAQNAPQICDAIIQSAELTGFSDLLLPVCVNAVGTAAGFANGIGGQALYAKYYEFVPLGNNNDKNAAHKIEGVHVHPPGQTIANMLGYVIEKNPVLHYPHTEATVQVSKLLNQINTPLECTPNPEVNPDPIEGEGDSCCRDGFSYGSVGADMCINDTVFGACQGFANSLCGAINLLPGIDPCNASFVAQQCQNEIINGDTLEQALAGMCLATLGATAGIPGIGPIVLSSCQGLLGAILNALEPIRENLMTEPLCKEGLRCNETGICTQPFGPLSCNKIEGKGTNYEPKTCEFAEVRVNLGDSLTFKDKVVRSYMFIDDVRVEVKQIECSNKNELDIFTGTPPSGCANQVWNECLTEKCTVKKCGVCQGQLLPEECASWPDCQTEIRIVIPTSPKIPNIDQIWRSTVIDKNTAFRRIFPKIEKGAPVSCIKQIPSTSKIVYITNSDTNLVKIDTAGPNVYSGNGPSSQSPAQIFFPHLGTVYEYFLKGIQTALRPKGFGNGPIPQGDPETCAPITGDGQCRMWLFMEGPGGYYYNYIISRAASTTCNGQALNPAWALFIAINESAGLMSDNPNGDGKDHFGCDQGGGAGYGLSIEEKTTCMLNTLSNDCSQGKTDLETLCEYGYQSACSGTYDDFGNMFLLGQPTNPPLWGSSSDTGSMVETMLGADYSSFSQFASDFCPNSTELLLPPYENTE